MYTLVKVYKEPDIGLYNKNTNLLHTSTQLPIVHIIAKLCRNICILSYRATHNIGIYNSF